MRRFVLILFLLFSLADRAESAFDTFAEAHSNLVAREGGSSDNIHYLSRGGNSHPKIPPEILREAQSWLDAHQEVESMLWAGGLAPNFAEKAQMEFSHENIVAWLRANANPLAEEYIRKTPR